MATKILHLDLETTGLFAYRCGVIQLGGIVEIDGENFKEFNLKCRPFPDDVVEPKALEANGVTEHEISQFQSPQEAYSKFMDILSSVINKYDKKDKLVLACYNSQFDEDFLRKWMKKCGDSYFGSYFWTPSLCTMKLVFHHLIPERHMLPNFKLGTVAKALGIEVTGKGLHDALTDVRLSQAIYRLCEKHTIR